MKTIAFSKVDLDITKQGDIVLQVKKPGVPLVSLLLSPDELMVFLAEATNKMFEAKLEALARVAEKNLQRERRKATSYPLGEA